VGHADIFESHIRKLLGSILIANMQISQGCQSANR